MGKKEKQSKNNTKGITLVALVITIIILLILAGIVITLTLGDKGIINMAKEAKESYENAFKQEGNELTQLEGSIGNYIQNDIGQIESQNKIYKVGTYDSVTVPKGSYLSSAIISANTIQIDIHEKYSDYKELTIDNFYTVDSLDMNMRHTGDVGTSISFAQSTQKVSYDAETGILTIIKPFALKDCSNDSYDTFGTASVTLYIIEGKITEL